MSNNQQGFFHIYRDVTRKTDDGELLPLPWVREWLHITKKKSYVWGCHDKATDISFIESLQIVENLHNYGNKHRYNYGKVWQY